MDRLVPGFGELEAQSMGHEHGPFEEVKTPFHAQVRVEGEGVREVLLRFGKEVVVFCF